MAGQITRYRAGPYYHTSPPREGGWAIQPWTGEIEVSADMTQWRSANSAPSSLWMTFCHEGGGLPLAELVKRGYWARVEPDLPDEMKVSEGL